jgi:hypothetical protein
LHQELGVRELKLIVVTVLSNPESTYRQGLARSMRSSGIMRSARSR